MAPQTTAAQAHGGMRPLEVASPAGGSGEGDLEEGKLASGDKERRQPLAWWFRLCCFCYSMVGLEMVWRMRAMACHCPTYPWHVEAWLLLLQGLLSFLHDAYFAGRSRAAKAADRSCATFLTLCQPLKFSFCHMDVMQLCLLLAFWVLGLTCYLAGSRAFAAGRWRRYQVFHSLWHVLLPMGGFLWIEYTRGALALWPVQAAGGLPGRGVPLTGLLAGPGQGCTGLEALSRQA
mmetsp:Transcript_25470/g.79393  ORF Transcript_25470/g.79393 Transcript_25470/m.79393 type:complete len:233 (+) Transcript_25470:31-729(+)